MKQNKGITLVALIITIIVMIILAGVTISLTVGDNGIFSKAKRGGSLYTNAQDEERAALNSFEEQIAGEGGNSGGNTPIATPVATTHTGATLTYTWAELSQVANVISANEAITKDTEEVNVTVGGQEYTVGVGDTVAFKYGEANHLARILGFNHDTLASDNTKKAGISFETVNCIAEHRMNASDASSGGWAATEMRTYLNNTTDGVINSLKDTNNINIKDYIKEVNKDYKATFNDANSVTSCTDKIWLLSCSEIWDDGYTEQGDLYGHSKTKEGEQYRYYARIAGLSYSTANNLLIKNYGGSARHWWLRSPNHNSNNYNIYFCHVYTDGKAYSYYAANAYGVVFGFSI